MRAIIYTRVSKDTSGDGLAVERQEEDCRKLAERLGYDVISVMRDNNKSAWSDKKKRPQYERLLEIIRSGGTDVVIAWALDRLGRRMTDLVRYVDACRVHEVDTHTVQGGKIDLSTSGGRLMLTQLAGIAQYEADLRSERILRVKLQRADQGKPSGGNRPFGWAPNGITQVEEEADAIKWGSQEILRGGTVTGVAREWRKRGLLSSVVPKDDEGNPLPRKALTVSGVRNVLMRPRNAGLRQHQGQIAGEAMWKPLISRAEWEALCGILTGKDRRTSFETQPKNLLSGIARCGSLLLDGEPCGTVMKVDRGGRKKDQEQPERVYVCNRQQRVLDSARDGRDRTGVRHTSVRVALAEPYVISRILSAALDFGFVLDGGDIEPVAPDLSQFKEKTDKVVAAYQAEAIDFDAFMAAQEKISADRKRMQAEHERKFAEWSAKRDLSDFGQDPDGVWGSMTIERQRNMLANVAEVWVIPAPKLGRNPDIAERFRITYDQTVTALAEMMDEENAARDAWQAENPMREGESLLDYIDRFPG